MDSFLRKGPLAPTISKCRTIFPIWYYNVGLKEYGSVKAIRSAGMVLSFSFKQFQYPILSDEVDV